MPASSEAVTRPKRYVMRVAVRIDIRCRHLRRVVNANNRDRYSLRGEDDEFRTRRSDQTDRVVD